jgi:hypothetical protein
MQSSETQKTNETVITMPPGGNINGRNSSDITTVPSKNTLPSLPENSGLVRSASMNLIDDTTGHLFDLMKGLAKNQTKENLEINIGLACTCADQIHKLLRLKLDVLKVASKK